jgi:hypothetical protein
MCGFNPQGTSYLASGIYFNFDFNTQLPNHHKQTVRFSSMIDVVRTKGGWTPSLDGCGRKRAVHDTVNAWAPET